MLCQVCDADNESSAVFCYKCGSLLRPAETSTEPVTGQTVDLNRARPPLAEVTDIAEPPRADPTHDTGKLEPLPDDQDASHRSARIYEAPSAEPAVARAYEAPPTEQPVARTYEAPPSPFSMPSAYEEPVTRYEIAPTRPSYRVPAPPSAPYVVGSPTLGVQTSNLATFSLILGLLSWTFVPFIAAIGAVITGHMGRREIAASDGQLTGNGLAVAGLILGYLNLAFGLIALIIACAFFGFIFSV